MKIKLITFCVSFVIITSAIFYVHYISWQIPHGTESDMYHMWKEGERIISGENTYERTLLGDMKENKKYATQFPLFYLFSASAQILGFDEYPEWLLFWQKVFFIFNIGIAYFIFHIIYFRYKWPLFAIFSSLVWLGHLKDLQGSRKEALSYYNKALKYCDKYSVMQHSQYGMFINRWWVKDRLISPFIGIDGLLN